MVNRIGDLVVKPRRSPWLRYGVPGAGLMVIVLAGIGLFFYGESLAGFDVGQASRKEAAARRAIKHLQHRIVGLTRELDMSKRLLQANEAAYQALSGSLKQADQKVMSLRERVGFYQAILETKPKGPGLKIDRFELSYGRTAWHYRLTLVQSFAFNRWVYAQVGVTVQGKKTGHLSEVSYPALVDKGPTVHFKYFNNVRGRFIVPNGFVPQQVIVRVTSAGHVLTHAYAWLQAGSAGPRK